MSELQVEASGETVGEAKWAALRQLEKQQPGLDKSAVRFEVVSEGERGLLGVGYAPARVLATLDAESESAISDESDLAAEARSLVERLVDGIGVSGRVVVDESDDAITLTVAGPDLGMLIGRHGQTIDAVQTLANAILRQDEKVHKQVVVDAAGYRDRRRRTIEALAVQSAEEALRSGDRVALEPMTSGERRLVHERLKDYDGVETSSEGDEPNRYVVVVP
jgi:spoIIIJ-associated protein